MWSNLVVLHSEDKERDKIHFENMFYWKTCMRTVYIGDSRLFPSNFMSHPMYQRFDGYDAYSLLLKIISGLKSRLLGETEVMRQFREQFKNESLPDTAFGHYMQKLRDELIEDSRKLRTDHLRNLGDQSYGGIAYRYLKNSSSITLFGTGQLAEQMLPWLQKTKANITVVGRNVERLNFLKSEFKVNIQSLSHYNASGEDIVIAAPISMSSWASQWKNGVRIIDFREDNAGDVYPPFTQYVSFASMLNALKENDQKNTILRFKLDSIVDEIVREREFGSSLNIIHCWEDIACVA